MGKVKVPFTLNDRDRLVRVFREMFQETPIYKVMNPTQKDFYSGEIKTQFFQTAKGQNPPKEVEEYKKTKKEMVDGEEVERIVEEGYIVKCKLVFPNIEKMSLELERRLPKTFFETNV